MTSTIIEEGEFGMKDNSYPCLFSQPLTQANKRSYIDTYLQRAVNATEVSVGINNALHEILNAMVLRISALLIEKKGHHLLELKFFLYIN